MNGTQQGCRPIFVLVVYIHSFAEQIFDSFYGSLGEFGLRNKLFAGTGVIGNILGFNEQRSSVPILDIYIDFILLHVVDELIDFSPVQQIEGQFIVGIRVLVRVEVVHCCFLHRAVSVLEELHVKLLCPITACVVLNNYS